MPAMTGAPTTKSTTLLQDLRALVALIWLLAFTNLAQIAIGRDDDGQAWTPIPLAASALGANLYFVALIFGSAWAGRWFIAWRDRQNTDRTFAPKVHTSPRSDMTDQPNVPDVPSFDCLARAQSGVF
jgi:hypothetical protein